MSNSSGTAILFIALTFLASGSSADTSTSVDPVRICLDAMNAECKKQHNPIDDKDGFVSCLDLMMPVCNTAYMSIPTDYETPPHFGLADEQEGK